MSFSIGSVDSPTLKVYKFEVGSAVQYGDPVQYGTIKQLRVPPGCIEQSASVEWVSVHCSDMYNILCSGY